MTTNSASAELGVTAATNNAADEQFLSTQRSYAPLQAVACSSTETTVREPRKSLSEHVKRRGERKKWKEQIDGFALFSQWEANQLEQHSSPSDPEAQHSSLSDPEAQHSSPNDPEAQYFLSTHLYDFPYQEYIAKMRAEPNESLLKQADAKLKFVEEQVEERKQRLAQTVNEPSSANDYRMFVCFLCGRAFDEELLMRQHINEHHLSNEGYKFKCTQCYRRFKLKHHWKRHERNHDSVSRFACDRCAASFSVRGSLLVHRSREHRVDEDDTPIDVLQEKCSRCKELFGTALELTRHEQWCLNTDRIKQLRRVKRDQQRASVSNSNTDAVSALARPKLDNSCPVCHNKFASQQSLVRHLARKHPDHAAFQKKYKACSSPYYPFACTQCNKRFASKASLTLHDRRHRGDLPHKCPRCQRCYPIASELKKHLATHSAPSSDPMLPAPPSDLNVL